MKIYSEKLIMAFLSNYMVKDIASSAGVSLTTIKRYKKDPAFLAVLNERRSAIVNAAVDRMNETILKDVNVLQEVIDDPDVNPAIRVNAINTKWVHLREWKAMIDFEKRLRALEGASITENGLFEPGREGI